MRFTALSDEATGELKCIISITGAHANEEELHFSVTSTKIGNYYSCVKHLSSDMNRYR